MGSFQNMTRRSFLAAAALAPIGAMAAVNEGNANPYHYHYDHLLGTSMDLVVWTRDIEIAERVRNTVID